MTTVKVPSVARVDDSIKLRGTENWPEWELFMGASFGITLDPLIAEGAKRPEGADEAAEWDALTQWANSQILAAIDFKAVGLPIAKDTRSTKDLWDRLNKLFNPESASTLLVEALKVLNLSMPSSPTVAEYDTLVRDFKADVERAKGKGMDIDSLLSIIFLHALPPSMETTVKIATKNRSEVPKLEYLTSTIRDQVVVDNASSTRESALSASSVRDSRSKSRSSTPRPPPAPCPACEGNHWLRECKDAKGVKMRKEKKAAWEAKKKGKETAAKAEEEEEASTAFEEAYIATNSTTSASTIIADTGATVHISPTTTNLSDVHNINPIRIRGLGGYSVATQAGQLELKTNKGQLLKLRRVLVLPSSSHTLISTSRLEDDYNYNFSIASGVMSMRNAQGDVVATASRRPSSRLFHFDGSFLSSARFHGESALTASKEVDLLTAHRRLCHLSLTSTQKLASPPSGDVNANKSSVHDLSEVINCEPCQLAKAKRHSHPSNPDRATQRLELVHSDLLELDERTHGNCKWAVTFMDDHSRYLEIYLLGKKSETLEVFKTFVAKSERQLGLKVKSIRSDHGGEYESHKFEDFCKSSGIEHQFSSAYTPEENGRAEAVNETITSRTRALLLDSGLSKRWWGEAMMNVVHTYNRSPHSALGGETPFALYHLKPPRYSHLRAFGCRVHVHIPRERRKKLDPTSYPGIFVGYGQSFKQYRIMDPAQPPRRSIRVVSAVKFSENVFPYKKDDISGSLKATTALPPSVRLNTSEPGSASGQTLLTRTTSSSDDQDDGVKYYSVTSRPSPSAPNPHWPLPSVRDLPEQQSSQSKPNTSSRDSPDRSSPLYGKNTAEDQPSPSPSPTPTSPSLSHQSPEQQHLPSIKEEPTTESPDPIDLLGNSAEEENPFDELARGGASSFEAFQALLAGTGTDGDGELGTMDEFTLPSDDPKTAKQARAAPDAPQWEAGMMEEFTSLITPESEGGYGVLQIVDRSAVPKDKTILPSKYVYARKRDSLGKVIDHRARLVSMGSQQVEGKDYFETYSPTLKSPSLRILFALATKHDLILEQSDISKAYLHGELEENERNTMYMLIPPVLVDLDPSLAGKAVLLKKALYGLKQAGRAWRKKLTGVLIPDGYKPTKSDECLLVKRHDTSPVSWSYMTIFVDDQLHAAAKQSEIDHQKSILKSHFKLKELGSPSTILGIQAQKTADGWHLSIPRYCETLARRFLGDNFRRVHIPMEPSAQIPPLDPSSPPHLRKQYSQLIGCLIYAAHAVRLDISYAVGVLGKCAAGPTEEHIKLALRVVRYLATYPKLGIQYRKDGGDPQGFADASFADGEKMRSTSGVVWTMAGGPVIWRSASQLRAASSTGEAEFLALSEASKDAVWLKSIHAEAGVPLKNPLTLQSDSTAALAYARDSAHHRRFRQVRVDEQVAKDAIADGTINAVKVGTKEQLADSLTKALPRESYQEHKRALSIIEPPPTGSRGGVERDRS